ncbi:MAG: ABC transporter substrate-binding protein [Gammaproteobacteria bacterium]|nr:ABC transporter substrate-binding protein [Gammaproteobacteria bacterium]
MKLTKIFILLISVIWLINAHSQELLEVPIGIAPTMSSVGVFIAKEKGYFAEQGIKPIINPFKASGAKMVPFLATGQLYVAGGNINAGMYNAVSQDIPIKIVADKGTVSPKHGYLALIVRKDHIDSGRYRSYKDLKGMTMAVTAKGVSQEIVTEMYLQKVGLSLSDIRLVTLGYSDINIALANKSIDASIQIEPFVAAAVKNDFAVRVAGDDEIYPNQQSAVIFMSPEFIEKHPKEAQGWVTAYVKGLRDYNDAYEKGKNKDEIINILTKYTRIKDASIYEKAFPVGLHPEGDLNVASLKSDAQWFYKKGYVKKLPDIDKIVDLSFVQTARKILGPYK